MQVSEQSAGIEESMRVPTHCLVVYPTREPHFRNLNVILALVAASMIDFCWMMTKNHTTGDVVRLEE